MPSVEERLAYLEGRVQEHGSTLGRTSEAITGVRTEIATLAADLRGEMQTMRSELRGEIAGLRNEMTNGFRWLVGLQALAVVAVVTALAADFFR